MDTSTFWLHTNVGTQKMQFRAAAACASTAAMEGALLIRDGDNVVVDERGEKASFIRVKANGNIKVGKKFVSMAPLVGAPFGSLFQLSADGKSLVRSDSPLTEFVTAVQDTEKDNSTLFDRNADNQKLGKDEIQELKKQGKSGVEIVEELCSNSATFEAKTEFSQDKYKRKKAKKYVVYIVARQPTARAICQAYYDKGPDRVFNLRFDSMAALLHLANIAAGTSVLVLDNCMGVVTGAVLERMAGLGGVCSTHLGRPFSSDALRGMNLSEAERAILCTMSIAQLRQAQQQRQAEVGAAAGPCKEQAAPGQPNAMQTDGAGAGAPAVGGTPAEEEGEPSSQGGTGAAGTAAAGAGAGSAGAQATNGQGSKASASVHAAGGAQLEKAARAQAAQALARRMAQQGFASCIVASPRIDTSSLMQQVLPLLQPSAPFVVFSPWPQPLADCMHQLVTKRQAVMLQLQESWMRPHQVLPMRTHPEMTCSGTGGYILSGIRALPDDGPQAGPWPGAGGGGGGGTKRPRED